METDRNILTDEKWSAIIRNDASYDGGFSAGLLVNREFRIKKTCWCLIRLMQRSRDIFVPVKGAGRTVFVFLMKNGLLKSLNTLNAIITNL